MRDRLSDSDYRRLLDFRTGLRRFIRWSEELAAQEGLTPAQHQLLLSIRGHDAPEGPTIGEVAADLMSRHHSVVELVDRAAEAGLVDRFIDAEDRRIVRLGLTQDGRRHLARLSALHIEELERLASRATSGLWRGLGADQPRSVPR